MPSPYLGILKDAFPSLSFLGAEPLAKHTYFKLGGPADLFLIVKDRETLAKLGSFCKTRKIPLTVLGGGSNVLVSDKGLEGLVIKNMAHAVTVTPDPNGESWILEADSGLQTSLLVSTAVQHELEGLEPFLGVPGTVGGAVYNNSHFTSKELLGSRSSEVEVIDASGDRRWIPSDQLDFSYDYSIFHKTQDIILAVRFLLKKGNASKLQQRVVEVTKKRATTQPLGMPSSGCMFQNVLMPDGTKVSAGYLIDKAGLKGTRVGDAMVSDVHANFIVNTGSATQADVETLAKKVEAIVKEKFGVELHREVFRIGKQ